MDFTEHLTIPKPDYPDPADIRRITEGMDIIDVWAKETDKILEKKLYSSTVNEIGPVLIYDNVPISDLQSLIDSIPKLMTRATTINVLPGNFAGPIEIKGFYGPSRLSVVGATAAGSLTHNVNRVSVIECSAYIEIRGISATNVSEASFSSYACSNFVYCVLCNCAGGSNSDTSNVGFHSHDGSGCMYSNNCTVSNKYQALKSEMSKLYSASPLGTNNSTVYRAEGGGIILRRSAGSISGTTLTSKSSGGLIVNTDSTFA